MVDAFDSVEVALVDGVAADEARLTVGLGLAVLADGDPGGTGLLEVTPPRSVGRALAQGVEVSNRERGEALIAARAEERECALAQLLRRRPRESAVTLAELGPPSHVRLRMAGAEGARGALGSTHPPVLQVLAH